MADQKSIFITGGAAGIGRAVAIHFARKGLFVGLADINDAGTAETAIHPTYFLEVKEFSDFPSNNPISNWTMSFRKTTRVLQAVAP